MIHQNQIVIEGVIVEKPAGKKLIIIENYMADERTMLVWVDTSRAIPADPREGERVTVVGRVDYQDDDPESMIVRAALVNVTGRPA